MTAPLPPAWLWTAFGASLLATLLLSGAVAAGWTRGVDERLFRLLHHRVPPRPDGRPRRLTTAARDLTALGGDTLRLLLLGSAALLFLADGRPRAALALVALFASARLALLGIKRLVRRPRPPAPGEVIPTYSTSFPSGHTFMAGVLFLSLALVAPAPPAVTQTALALALAGSAAIGLTRTSFAIHWPTDVAVGWLAAIAWVSGWALASGGTG